MFGRTKHGCDKVVRILNKKGVKAAAIHGNKSQNARTKALEGFKKGTIRVLVATDIAARGLDIPLLPHVINFELPNVPEDYVHRIGRTGRAGASGDAISLVSAEEFEFVQKIEKLLGLSLKLEIIKGFEPSAKVEDQKKSSPGRDQNKPHSRNNKNFKRKFSSRRSKSRNNNDKRN